MMSLEWV